MYKKMLILLVTIALFFVESVFLTRFTWSGVTLPLTFAFGLAVAVVGDEWDTIFIALVTGFLADSYTNHLFGINMLLNLYIFLGLHFGKNYLRHEKNILMAIVMGAAAFIRFGLLFGLNAVTGLMGNSNRVPILTMLVLIAAIPVLLMTRRILRKQLPRTRLR